MKKIFIIIITLLLIVVAFLVSKPKETQEVSIKSNTINFNKEMFTTEELRWINKYKYKDIYVGISQDYSPIEYIDESGNPRGIGTEIIKRVNKFTGLQFKMYKDSYKKTWNEILQSTFKGEIDILPSVSFTKERAKYLDFSDSYIEMNQVIIGHEDNPKLINKFSQVEKNSFAVPPDYWVTDVILKKNPNAKIIEVKNMKEALRYVSNKKADYAICEIPVFTYYKEQGICNNIKIIGELEEKNEILIGVRKEFSPLIPIINKVIKKTDRNELYENAIVMPKNILKEKKLILMVMLLMFLLFILIYSLYRIFKKLIMAKKEAENANRQKTSLMANIAHDLRTPITVIIGYTQAIVDGNVKREENKEKYIKRIHERTKYLSDLVDDFFLLSRFEDGKLILIEEDVNMNDFIKDIVEDVAFKAKSKNIQILMKLDKKTDINKKIDRLKVCRVIENIIMNAIRYSEENGIIEIATTLEEDKIKIVVKDNGIGIKKEDIPHVFERYYKGKNSKKESIGLGLYIAKEIINKHNGEIWVESEWNKGSMFYILI